MAIHAPLNPGYYARRRSRRRRRRTRFSLLRRLRRLAWPLVILFGVAALILFIPQLMLLGTDEQALYASAEQELDSGDPRVAATMIDKVIEISPQWAEAYLLRAKIDIALMDGTAASEALDTAHNKGMAGERLHAYLGAARFLDGNYEGAEEALKAKVAPEDLGLANRLLARLAMDRGEWQRAGKILDLAQKFAADDPGLWADYAVYYDRTDRSDQALAAIRKALTLDPENLRALEVAGHFAEKRQGPEAGLVYYRRGLKRAPDDLALLESEAKALGALGQHRKMLSVVKHMLDVTPNHAGAHYLLAWLAVKGNNAALAQNLLERAQPVMAEMPAFILLSGIVEYRLKNFNRAVDRFRELLKKRPDNVTARKLLAASLLNAGDPLSAYREIAPLAARPNADAYTRRLAARTKQLAGHPVEKRF